MQFQDLPKLLKPIPPNQEKNILIYSSDTKETVLFSSERKECGPPGEGSRYSVSKAIQAVLELKIMTFLEQVLQFIQPYVPKEDSNHHHADAFYKIKKQLQSMIENTSLQEEFVSRIDKNAGIEGKHLYLFCKTMLEKRYVVFDKKLGKPLHVQVLI